ncbi:uncharacterized protein PHACADRAFT_257455 [Phanerochaete carnosa HHB-10118-sp]|uniref:Uncharacterized protein n=1 Tax=Phanerochaete carnosa (strain HHB-10118-sp) TaxID=650164 RepID=K5VR55_PHACS|nr:uncharacterized protein PHACADRAFT_257455 [Phanerochaete carnosa HHB-10118-sp]EKM53948.1 hypothetical protein PHACADRAFT_257455 [Phanerochaete carnosa HHB-10118-sp]
MTASEPHLTIASGFSPIVSKVPSAYANPGIPHLMAASVGLILHKHLGQQDAHALASGI